MTKQARTTSQHDIESDPQEEISGWPLRNCDEQLIRRRFSGKGTLTMEGTSNQWSCKFEVAQLINGKLVVRVFDLSFSDFVTLSHRAQNWSSFELSGYLPDGSQLSASEIISRSKSNLQRDGNDQRKAQTQLDHFPQPHAPTCQGK